MVLAARPPVSITRTVGLASDRPFKTRSPSPGPPVAASPRRARRPRRRPTLAPLTRASGRALPQGPSGSRHAGERQDDSENSRHRARGPTRRQDGQAGGGSTPQHRFEARFGAGPNQDGTRSHIALQDKRHTGSVARLPAVPHRTPSLGYSQLRSASTGGSTPRRSAQRVPATSCTTGKSFRVAIQRQPAWVPRPLELLERAPARCRRPPLLRLARKIHGASRGGLRAGDHVPRRKGVHPQQRPRRVELPCFDADQISASVLTVGLGRLFAIGLH